jgi:nucleoid-associated protein EbfC
MRDIMGMMGKLQEMQQKMQAMQAELEAQEITGQSGGGMVTVTLNGKGDMRSIKIDPSLMKPDEAEILEDLVVAATQDAKGKVEAAAQAKMQEMTGGLPLPPGLKLW